MDQIIELKNITKEFHGVAALRHVNFALRAGEVHSLLGENGAGKSTLTKIIAGVYPASSGQVLLSGRAVSFADPADALRNGIAMVFQQPS
ncbi:ATP-binding cassette domain-containing protein [Verminephrobacter eiseniae]|uniref:ATP-binding cassette domain-containing protein n=1 Tax=Verminephrobacter eiseniae TaxID=364317 RepID=UPI002AA2A4EC|nr:ATP-binding cassette domain-containing protein [Verminephrobacter eiseniae]